MIFFLLLMMLIIMVLIINSFSSLKNKNSFCDMPFECGVSSNTSSRKPYSLPFFSFTLVFLLFDMEVILIFPFSFFEFSILFVIFYLMIMVILVISLLYEWMNGSLKW